MKKYKIKPLEWIKDKNNDYYTKMNLFDLEIYYDNGWHYALSKTDENEETYNTFKEAKKIVETWYYSQIETVLEEIK